MRLLALKMLYLLTQPNPGLPSFIRVDDLAPSQANYTMDDWL